MDGWCFSYLPVPQIQVLSWNSCWAISQACHIYFEGWIIHLLHPFGFPSGNGCVWISVKLQKCNELIWATLKVYKVAYSKNLCANHVKHRLSISGYNTGNRRGSILTVNQSQIGRNHYFIFTNWVNFIRIPVTCREKGRVTMPSLLQCKIVSQIILPFC